MIPLNDIDQFLHPRAARAILPGARHFLPIPEALKA
jgi:hypothetical protein